MASSNPHKHKLQKLQDKLRLVERDRDAEVKVSAGLSLAAAS